MQMLEIEDGGEKKQRQSGSGDAAYAPRNHARNLTSNLTGLQQTAFPEVQLQEDILDGAQDDCCARAE